MKWTLGLHFRAMLVALFVLALVPTASAMDNACYFRVTGTATITTYGEIRNPDGSIS